MTAEVWTIVVAAGSGSRFGGPKQLSMLGDRPLVGWAASAARSASDGVVVVTSESLCTHPSIVGLGVDAVVAGGSTRSASVRAGLAVVPPDAEIIVVHDAARPLAGADLFERVIAAVRAGAEGAVPAVPVVDTLRHRRGGVVDRDQMVAVQTPQAFSAAALRQAHASGSDATDDARLVEAVGGRVVVIDGIRENLKVTEPMDLRVAATFAGVETDGARVTPTDVRVGTGFDVHRFSDDPERALVLGGVVFPGERGLSGHSDADAVAHACAESVLGAAGLDDLGQLFPDTDDQWKGADSVELLAEVARRVAGAGWAIANIDCSVVAERPKLAPVKAEMQRRLSAAVGAPVSVAGRRAEGIGGLGRGEGIAALATAMLVRRTPGSVVVTEVGI